MSRKQKLKARDRITQKMSRDGLIERNETIGEDIRISKREAGQDLRGGKTDSGTSYQLDKRPSASNTNKKNKQRRISEHLESVKTENKTSASVEPLSADVVVETPKQTETPILSHSEPSEYEEIRNEQPLNRNEAKPFDGRRVPQKAPPVKSKPPPVISETSIIAEQSTTTPQNTEMATGEPHTPLKHEDSGKFQFEHNEKLHFEHEEKPVPDSRQKRKSPQGYKRGVMEQADNNAEFDNLPPVEKTPDAPQSLKTQNVPTSTLKHKDNGRLHFEREEKPVPDSQRRQKPPQNHKPENAELTKSDTSTDNSLPLQPMAEASPNEHRDATTDSQENAPNQPESGKQPLKHEKSDRLQFEKPVAETPLPIKPKRKPIRHQTKQSATETKPTDTPNAEKRYEKPESSDKPKKPAHTDKAADISDKPQAKENGSTDSPLHSEKTDAPLHENKEDVPLKPDKPGKLKFSEDETPALPTRSEAKQQRKYNTAQKQTEKAVQKLDTAKSKLPSKKKLRSMRVFNEETGRPKRKLYFESEVKSQGEQLKGALPLRPVKAAGNSALAFGHRKMFQVERENVAAEAAHKVEMSAEGGIRMALHHYKTAPYRKVQKLERKVQKKSIKAAYQKALAENPKLKSNVLSRAFQKRKIKKDYAKAAREAQKAAKNAKKAGSAAAKMAKAIAGVIKRHPIASAIIILILLLLFCLMSLIGAFGSAGTGGLGAVLSASYLAEDADIDNAELAYTEWEVDLQEQIANTETTHTGYDEYRYNIGEISHNPYELMAYLTVRYQNFTYAAIESDLWSLFGEQYSLTYTPSTETRYADPTDANEDGDYEPYDWNVLTVTLTARSFGDVALSHLSDDQFAHYALLLQTNGARQYLANPFGDMNWLPYVTSYYGYRIHPISGVKNLHRGVDIGLPTGTEIHSGQNGTVTFAGYSGDYGNVVVIEDENGLVSKYAHCDSLLVSTGQTVNTGDVIATVGNTGNSTGPHLHLEVLKNGQYLNALYFCDSGSFNLTPSYGYAGAPMGDGSYAALLAEAERYLSYPYVWGGSSPETSFDCSGYISYILRSSGVKDVGRLGAQGLYNISTPVSPSEARPGDLVFFHSTYSAPLPVTHVGLYVGTDATGRPRMIHCGNPIQYTYIDTAYWQQHFYAFGRVSSD